VLSPSEWKNLTDSKIKDFEAQIKAAEAELKEKQKQAEGDL